MELRLKSQDRDEENKPKIIFLQKVEGKVRPLFFLSRLVNRKPAIKQVIEEENGNG